VLWQGQYKEKDTDFSQSLAKVKTLGPDVFFIPGYDMESALIMKQSRAQGVKSIFLGGDGWNFDIMYNYAGQAVEGAYHSDYWHPDVNIPKSKQLQVDFQRKYGDKYGKSMRSDIPSTYDAVMILAEAIKRAGSLDRAKIRDALAATKNFQGTTGIITFDENRDPLNKEMVVLQYKNGKQLFIKKVKP
jgi:branched-chain amino acid transport system substrate-binding protein